MSTVRPLDDPDWARLLMAARRRLESNGRVLTGAIGLAGPTDGERRVVIGITGVHRPAGVGRVVVKLLELDVHLRQSTGRGLVETLTAMNGAPLRDRAGERAREAADRDAAIGGALGSRWAGEEWFGQWLAWIREGMLTRLVRTGGDLSAAVRVIDELPAADEPIAVFAERVLGDTKALDDPTLRRLVLRAIAAWQGAGAAGTALAERELWESAGVVPDDLASQVLVLNVPADGGLVGQWLTQAAAVGMPMRLTLQQVRLTPLTIDQPEIFVTENPAVLRVAASALGLAAPALVCTEGVPSVAVHALLAAAPRARLHWRNDFDWPGVRMLTAALTRYPGLVPWRMSVADYESAADVGTTTLLGAPAPTPWDPALGEAMRRHGRAVMEERLLPLLLDDLRGRSREPAA